MDKNTIAGLVIIFLILIGFSYFTRPSKEQVAEMQRKQDSIARVDRLRAQELAAQQQAQKTPDNTTAANPLATKSDSIFVQNDTENKIITLENDKIKLHISTLGGRIVYVDLKEYRTHDSLPLVLWKNGETAFGMNLSIPRNFSLHPVRQKRRFMPREMNRCSLCVFMPTAADTWNTFTS